MIFTKNEEQILALERRTDFFLLNGQRITALPCIQPSAALCDQHKLRSTPALSLHPGAQAPASPPPVIFRRITSPDVPPGITSSRQRASLPAMLFAASLPRMFFRASLPGEASLASRRRRHCVLLQQCLLRGSSWSFVIGVCNICY